MGKRIALDSHTIPSKRKKLNNYLKEKRKYSCSSNDQSSDEESSIDSSETIPVTNQVVKYDESPKPIFQLSGDIVIGTILTDLNKNKWRVGKPIGKGSFGELFLASNNIASNVTKDNARYVVKIEPHTNGPLFVEIHCLLNTSKPSDDDAPAPPGVPPYIASGSHYFRNERYRFLILPRYDRDLHSIIKHCRVSQKSVLVLAVQILDILQHLHDKGYCHSDIKAENLMVGKCTYNKSSTLLQYKNDTITISDTEDENSSEEFSDVAEENESDDNNDEDDTENENEEKDSDSDEESYDEDENGNTDSEDENDDAKDSESYYRTPVRNNKSKKVLVEFSGSNPVRSCRAKNNSSLNSTIYEDMVKSHYLRPSKKINYASFFNDDENSNVDDFISRHNLNRTISNTNNTSLNKSTRNSTNNQHSKQQLSAFNDDLVTENRIFLIDYGLALKFVDSSNVHRPFCMDQRRAHDGTLEFTSRDAHMGAHSRRSDLECLGYNILFWSQGFLPWKEKARKQQHEKVHGMKEYLMADVREMLKHIYGKQVPKYLGEFMAYVGKLAYDERPDYGKCRKIFLKEYIKLGYKIDQMKLDINDLINNSVNMKQEIENNNLCRMKNIKSIMKNLGVIIPFRESNVNRVSPKNLRSKEKNCNKKKKKFSWAEILSQDPDQIARQRAEKEFERDSTETPVIRYQGKPTYAILEVQKRKKFMDRLETVPEEEPAEVDNLHIKGYTKQMMELLKKRQHRLFADIDAKKTNKNQNQQNLVLHSNNRKISTKKSLSNSNQDLTRTRNKEGLRTTITPTKRGLDYNYSKQIKRRGQKRLNTNSETLKLQNNGINSNSNNISSTNGIITSSNRTRRNIIPPPQSATTNLNINTGNELTGTDESSCSSLNSIASSNDNSRSSGNSKKSTKTTTSSSSSSTTTKVLRRYGQALKTVTENENSNASTNSTNSNNSTSSNNSCSNSNNSFPASLSDEDTRDVMVSFPPKSRQQRQQQQQQQHHVRQRKQQIKKIKSATVNRLRIRINGNSAAIVKNITSLTSVADNSTRIGVTRTRKKSIPQKRNVKNLLNERNRRTRKYTNNPVNQCGMLQPMLKDDDDWNPDYILSDDEDKDPNYYNYNRKMKYG